MATVSYKRVCKTFADGTEALVEFDLHVNDGELMVLVGPSGCGKSTALRLLAGLETVSSGELHIEDAVVNDVSPQQRNIAMVFQNYALYPHMSVRRNLEFPLRMMKLPAEEVARRTA
ncbi:MAG: ABC transporter ATP-binding protein, partial [Granulosicoccaceae bacterium]